MGLFRHISESLQRLRQRLRPYLSRPRRPVDLTVNDEGVTQRHGDGKVEHIAWNDLADVTIVTTDNGPFLEDVFIVLSGGSSGSVVITQGADKEARLIDRLLRLPGFNHDAFTEAMCCAQNQKFPCWRRGADSTDKGQGL